MVRILWTQSSSNKGSMEDLSHIRSVGKDSLSNSAGHKISSNIQQMFTFMLYNNFIGVKHYIFVSNGQKKNCM